MLTDQGLGDDDTLWFLPGGPFIRRWVGVL